MSVSFPSIRNLLKNSLFSISFICSYFLLFRSVFLPEWMAVLSVLTVLLSAVFSNTYEYVWKRLSLSPVLGAVLICALAVWVDIQRSKEWTDVILGLAAVPATVLVLELARSSLRLESRFRVQTSKERSLTVFLVSALTSILVLMICSKSSPLYPFNDWGDANCFFTVGKSVVNGLIPYRDLYEQKGPLLYFLHTLASLVSRTSFIGVYFIEAAAAAFFLYYSFKAIQLLLPKISVLIIPVIGSVIYTFPSFCHGDSCEELVLPFLAYGVYCAVKAIKTNKLPSWQESLLIGVTSGCVFWIKFNLTGFYIGWFLAMAVLAFSNGEILKLVKMGLLILLGVLIATAPIVIYFYLNGALMDMLEVYLYNNIVVYANIGSANESTKSSGNFLKNLYAGLTFTFHYDPLLVFLTAFSAAGMWLKRNWKYGLSYSLMVFFTFAASFIGSTKYLYYQFILSALVPIGIAVIWTSVHYLFRQIRIPFKPAVRQFVGWSFTTVFCLYYVLQNCSNLYMLQYSKEDLPQFQFAEIMNQEENPTMLNYGFLDSGFYTAADIVPDNRFFSKLNINLEEQTESLENAVQDGKEQFIITFDEKLQSDQYEEIAQSTYLFEGRDRTYYLFKRIDQNWQN